MMKNMNQMMEERIQMKIIIIIYKSRTYLIAAYFHTKCFYILFAGKINVLSTTQ